MRNIFTVSVKTVMKVIGLILCVCTGCTYVTSQMLPPPTAIFPYRTFLDNARNVILRWNFNDTHIAFELIGNTLGYVGFGISESRKMYPADIFVAYVKNDIVYYADFHTKRYGQPDLDAQQDWNLKYGYEENGKSIFGIIRKLETCDTNDLPITKRPQNLIYAYHPTDPVSITDLPKHTFTRRGSKKVTLLEPPPEPNPPALPANTKTLPFEINNYSIPVAESSVHCFIYNMSHVEKKFHIVKVEPLFDPRTRDNVQHMTLYRCHVPDTANFQTGNHYNCLSGAPKQLEFCQDYVAGFGHDDGAMYLPEDMGLGIGGKGESNLYILSIQYENRRRLPNLLDSSGISVSYTATLRPNEGAFLNMGLLISKEWYQFIPPGETDFLDRAYCSHKCITWGNIGAKNQTQMTAVGVRFHSHELGKQMKLRHVTHTDTGTTEHPWLSHVENFNSKKSKLNLFETRTPIETTDSLLLECSYDSSAKSSYTLGGWKKENELCRAYVLYYPRKKLESCLSWSNYDQLKNERGQTVDAKNIFSSLKATDWTNNDLMRNNLKTSLRSSVEMEQCWASSREQKFAYSYFNQPTISSPYNPSACPATPSQ